MPVRKIFRRQKSSSIVEYLAVESVERKDDRRCWSNHAGPFDRRNRGFYNSMHSLSCRFQPKWYVWIKLGCKRLRRPKKFQVSMNSLCLMPNFPWSPRLNFWENFFAPQDEFLLEKSLWSPGLNFLLTKFPLVPLRWLFSVSKNFFTILIPYSL